MAILQWAERWDGSDVEWFEVWGTPLAPEGFDLEATAAIALTGVLALAGDIEAPESNPWEFEPPLSITPIAGVLALTGDLQFRGPFDLTAGVIGISGAASVAGDLQIETPVVVDLAFGTVGIAGAMLVSGNLAMPGPNDFDLAAAPLTISGAVGVAGNVEYSGPFNLTQASPIAMAGPISLAGTLAFAGSEAPLIVFRGDPNNNVMFDNGSTAILVSGQVAMIV